MIWQSATFWKDKTGLIWMALRGHPNHRDCSMGVVESRNNPTLIDRAYQKQLAWCRSHNLKITDETAEASHDQDQ